MRTRTVNNNESHFKLNCRCVYICIVYVWCMSCV